MRPKLRGIRASVRLAGAGLMAGAVASSCGVSVDMPGVSAQVSTSGALMDFLLGSVEVSERGVFVDAPFVDVNIYAPRP